MIDSQCPCLRQSDPWVVLALNVKRYASCPQCPNMRQCITPLEMSVGSITLYPEFRIIENTVTDLVYRPYAVTGSNIPEANFLKNDNSILN